MLAEVTGVALPDLYGEIARTGLVGVLFVLVVYALIRRDGDLTKERDARLADAKEVTKILTPIIESSTAARVASTAATEERNRLMEEIMRRQGQQK